MSANTNVSNVSMESELLHQCNLCGSELLDVLDADCNIARCRSCGFVFDNPRPTLNALIDFYSKPGKYDSWLVELQPRERLWRRRLRKIRSTKRPGTLLDVGTGIGQFLSLARNDYSEVHGTEVSSTAVEIAREKYGLNLFHGTVDDLPSQGRTFDNITLFHVLEHVPDPKAMLQTCHSLLKPGGCLVIAVPNEVASVRGFKRRLFSRLRKQPGGGVMGLPRLTLDGSISEIHLSHFSPPVLARLLEATGFSVTVNTLDPYYVRTGPRRLKADFFYYSCLALRNIFGMNIYDTILVIAYKNALSERSSR